jgi:hypothetical protein
VVTALEQLQQHGLIASKQCQALQKDLWTAVMSMFGVAADLDGWIAVYQK